MTRPRTEGRVRACSQLAKASSGLVWVSAEQQGGQGGGVHDPFHVVDDGQFHPGVGRGGTQALQMWMDLMTASADRSLRTLPSTRGTGTVPPSRSTRVRRIRRRPGRMRSGCSGCRGRPERPGTTSCPRSSLPRGGGGGGAGDPVVEFEPRPASPPRFIEENTTLSSSAPSNTRSSRMSAVASTPSTPGSASAAASGRAGRCASSSPSGGPRPRGRRGRGGRRR